MEMHKSLRIPLYKLYYINDVKKFYVDEGFVKRMERDYSTEDRKKIKEALQWALENPDFDFKQLLPGLMHSNDDILHYFDLLYSRIFGPADSAKQEMISE